MATLKLRGKMWYSRFMRYGKRVEVALDQNKTIAQGMIDELVAMNRLEKLGLKNKNVSWRFFKIRYHEFSKANKVSHTIYRDQHSFQMMEDVFQIIYLSQITPELLERLKFRLQEQGRPLSVVTRCIKAIKTAMRQAEAWNYIQPQAWHSVKVKEPKGRLHFLSKEELPRLFQVCKGYWLTAAMIMSRAGLRRGEVFHLEWSDINFATGKIWIHSHPCDQCESCKDRGNMWIPKAEKERRVPMVADLQAFLEGLPNRQGFVLSDDRPTLGSFDVLMRERFKEAGLRGSAHTLRHTFASHAIMDGVDPYDLKDMLGHSSIKLTEQYAHLAPESTQNAIKKMKPLAPTLPPGSAYIDVLRVI